MKKDGKLEKNETIEDKMNVIADDELEGITGGRRQYISGFPHEDTTTGTPDFYDPIPEVPLDLDPSLLHW